MATTRGPFTHACAVVVIGKCSPSARACSLPPTPSRRHRCSRHFHRGGSGRFQQSHQPPPTSSSSAAGVLAAGGLGVRRSTLTAIAGPTEATAAGSSCLNNLWTYPGGECTSPIRVWPDRRLSNVSLVRTVSAARTAAPYSSIASVSQRALGVVAADAVREEVAEAGDARAGEWYFSAGDVRPVVLYDGVCNFCNGGVNFVLQFDRTGKLRLAALQSDAGRALLERCGRQPDDISSIVLVEKDRYYVKSEAVLRIGQLLDVPVATLAPLALLVPSAVRDGVYDTVASNRYNIMGKRDVCRVGDNSLFNDRFLQ